jgi:hypothetical protein
MNQRTLETILYPAQGTAPHGPGLKAMGKFSFDAFAAAFQQTLAILAAFGAQQLTFFNTNYDNHCYLPMLGFVSFDNEPDQFEPEKTARTTGTTARGMII